MSLMHEESAPADAADSPPAFSLSFGNADARRFVSSQEDLAVALDVSRRTVSRWLKHPRSPGRTANGSYELEAWRRFKAELKEDSDGDSDLGDLPADVRAELARLRIRREAARAEYEELKTAELRKDLLPRADVLRVFGGGVNALRSFIYGEFVGRETDPDRALAARERVERCFGRAAKLLSDALEKEKIIG